MKTLRPIMTVIVLTLLCLLAPLTVKAEDPVTADRGSVSPNNPEKSVVYQENTISRYTLNVTQNGKLDISIWDSTRNYTMFYFHLLDADGKSLVYSYTSDFADQPVYVMPGTYYIDIQPMGSGISLKTSFLPVSSGDSEPNNDQQHAQALTPFKQVSGFVTAQGDAEESLYKDNEDWYTFTLKKKDTIALSLIFEEKVGSAILYDQYMQEVQAIYKFDPHAAALGEKVNVSKGKYYIKVTAWDIGIGGRYYLMLDSAQARKVPKVTGVKVKAAKKKLNVSWKKMTDVKGYQVYASLKKKSGYKKIAVIKKASTAKATIKKVGGKKLQAGKKYFVKIRAYKKVNGETVYGKYSTPKSVKAK